MINQSEIELWEEANDRLMALEDERREMEEIIASIRRFHQFNPDSYDPLPSHWLSDRSSKHEEF